ncbi:MAG: radical SAM protein [Methanosarcinales archaeon]|nr:MAG: radical SAM protein [Methanosarcinales archaeon]
MEKLKENAEGQYGFYGRLTADFPSQIIVDCTEVCNLACIHCAHPAFKKSVYYAGRSLDPALNVKLVNEVRQHGRDCTQYIRYSSNGEPLIHRHIFDMVDYAVRNSGVTVTLTTNGTLLNQQRIEGLLTTGVDVVDISIDAFTPDTYAQIRVNGDLQVTRANVLMLLQMARQASSRTKVVVSYIEQPQNMHETKDFEAFWRDNGADYVVIRRLHSNAGAIVPVADLMRTENESELRRPCTYPWERIVLNARGFLSFCPADWTHGSTIAGADYRTKTIQEVWQGEFYQKLREAHLTNNYNDHQFCGQCPDWRSTRWPHEGRSYANMMEEFKDTE